jgi:SAM-dependent methyltransferase
VGAEFARRGQHRGIWNESLIEFYNTTDAFLYESIVWNRAAEKRRMRRWIADWIAAHCPAPARVLVYGDGLGFDSLYLSGRSHRVDYFDVSRYGVEFARRAFARHENAPTILPCREEALQERYDVVVCLDVLEHVPEPSATVGLLVSTLRAEGHLIVHAPFWYLGRRVPTHLRSNRRYSGDLRTLYRPLGLDLVDGCFFWNPIVLRKSSEDAGKLRRPRGVGLRLGLGGCLLSVARVWAVPHILAFEWLFAGSAGKWPELERLADQYGVRDGEAKERKQRR